MKGTIIYIIFLALLALAFGLGRYTAEPVRIVEERAQRDTLVIRDTLTQYQPKLVRVHTRDTISVTLTEVRHDTVAVYLPRETKIYEDARYRAEVSGYQPSLDRIDIFTQTQIVTQSTAQVVRQKTRWGIGISAGYGVAINTTNQTFKPAPYIGVGIQYNLVSW
jgi:hypothetical protein